jgi:protein-S-isoprenylcysteine O-methyltransferase Ste14
MIQLPYRDIIPQADNGGESETKVHPMVSAAKEEAVNRTKTRNSVSCKSKWEEEVKEKREWKRIACQVTIALLIIVIGQLFGKHITRWMNPNWMILFAVIIALASYAWDKWLSLTAQENEQKRNAAKQERDHRIRMSKLEQ